MNEETKSGWRKQQIQERISMNEEDYQAVRKVLLDTLEQLDEKRNDTIEEVAQAIEQMTRAFGEDTIASFASYIRGMKKFGSMKND
jgi:predicted MarR family transcription regulator